ncbi:MAG: alanine racemase [Lachnospira sp.]|nr:alanine racemase [Lachnospira sp.]
MNKYYRVYADIDLDAIIINVKEITAALEPDTKIFAVIKADGYGHGAVAVAKAIEKYVYGFAVATVIEGMELRENEIKKPILILGYTPDTEFETLIENDIDATVFSLEDAIKLDATAKAMDKLAKCHIKIDTGMNRIGFVPSEKTIEDIINIKKLDNLDARGIFTHFASSDSMDRTFANKQYDIFNDLLEKLYDFGIEFEIRHCANSAAIINMPNVALDAVRAGIAIYGMYPSDYVNKRRVMLRPALELKSHVAMVKEVKEGEGISYSSTYVTPKQMKIATIPVGYGDGYPRSLSNKGYVLINGCKANIVGRICMDQMMVDVTDIENVNVGDTVVIIGRDGNECITVEELGELSGRFNYEFTCCISKRVPRNYHLKSE